MLKNIVRWIKYVLFFNIRGIIVTLFPGRNEKEIQSIKNINFRDRCFIVATGPSLTINDVECLKNEITFGVNSIFLIYNKTAWRPTHYVCTDDGYFKKLKEEYALDVEKLAKEQIFLNDKNLDIVKQNKKIKFLHFSRWNRAVDFKWPKFNDNISKGVYAFGTVTNIAITIAMYMGYKEIYLIGCDCSNLNRHIVNDVSDNDKTDEKAKEIAEIQIKGYRIMKKIADKRGIKIYNATRGGALEEFDRVDFDNLILKIRN